MNVSTWIADGEWVSFQDADVPRAVTAGSFARHGFDYLALGHGSYVRSAIFGDNGGRSLMPLEATACGAILVLLVFAARSQGGLDPALRAGLIAAAGYAGIALGLYLLPLPAWKPGLGSHHLLVGTPFQYLAVALVLTGLGRTDSGRGAKFARRWLCIGLGIWLVVRVPSMISLERSLARGAMSIGWDPSLTRIGEFAGRRANDAIFIATDWGVATQIYCFANGKVAPIPPRYVAPEAFTRSINDTMTTAPGWIESPVEDEVANLRAVAVRKFVRVRDGGGGN